MPIRPSDKSRMKSKELEDAEAELRSLFEESSEGSPTGGDPSHRYTFWRFPRLWRPDPHGRKAHQISGDPFESPFWKAVSPYLYWMGYALLVLVVLVALRFLWGLGPQALFFGLIILTMVGNAIYWISKNPNLQ